VKPRQRGRLGEAESDSVDRPGGLAVAELRRPVGEDHRRGAGEEPDRGRERPSEAPLDRPLEGDPERGRRDE
jgi:hypothetical protein